jgi:antitoxin YefM
MAVTAGRARKNLGDLIDQVNDDHIAIEIISDDGAAVLMSLPDYQALEETVYLLRGPANAGRLLESIDQARTDTTECRTSH